ncbi:MAG: hypothetical protein OEM15_00305 [Myxococcales bacterium]|nr:hypothetical protein [Myxococcales bacterium]MDH3482869.1 hypothetical protein [Myxococcales bacterium]
MRVAAVLCVLCLAGCNAYDDLPLLDIEAIEPPQIEPGGRLRIHGEGFPLGRQAVVSLHGALYRPGAPASPIEVHLPGKVQTETLIEAPIDAELMRSIGGRATFDGRLRLAFRASNDRRDVFAEQPALIDFLPDTSTQLRDDPDADELARPIDARHFGVTLSREESGTVGVLVDAVDPHSFAATQGVQPGDTLVGLDGVRLYSWRDFLPDPAQTESRVLVVRAGLTGVHTLRWPHAATERRADPLTFGVLLLLGLLLGWLSPIALCFGKGSSASISVGLTRLSLVLVFVAALFCTPALQWTTIWILILGLLAALYSLTARERDATRGFAFAVSSTLTVMLLARTASIESIVAVQEGAVLDWYVFRTPATTLAFASYLYALRELTAQGRLSASLFTSAAAVLGAALFLGGWEAAEPIAGILMLVAKAGAVLVGARFFRMSREVAIVVSGLALSLALLGVWVGTDALLPYWSALAAGSIGALMIRAVIPVVRRPSAPAVA